MLYVSDDLHPDRLFLLVAGVPKRTNFRKKIFKNLLLRNCLLYEVDTLHPCSWHSPLQKKLLFFCSSQIRTLVAMATFSFHRLINGKVKICYFCSLIGDIRILFLENVY